MSKVVYDFTGECFVVTGASSGMGRQIALELAEAGADVLAVARNEERLHSLKSEYPERIITASLDVRDTDALEEAIAGFTAIRGKLNGGVHAAGIGSVTPLRSYEPEIAREVMDTSFWAGMSLLQLITKSKYGKAGTSTVLFSSVDAVSCGKGKFAYASSKAAVNTAIRCAAKEIAPKHHRVNSVLPGWVITPMTDNSELEGFLEPIIAEHLLGLGRPEYVSSMVLFLLSSDSSWITGSNIVVDGGSLA